MVSDGPTAIASCAKNDSASSVMWLRRSPSVMLNALAVPERNAAMLGKIELAGALREVVVEEAAELAAGLARVAAGDAGQRVVEHVERVLAALRQSGRAAKVERAGDDHLRQPDRTIDAVGDPEIQPG